MVYTMSDLTKYVERIVDWWMDLITYIILNESRSDLEFNRAIRKYERDRLK